MTKTILMVPHELFFYDNYLGALEMSLYLMLPPWKSNAYVCVTQVNHARITALRES